TLQRGFYNYYPLKRVNQGAIIVANVGDPESRMTEDKTKPMPFLVITDPSVLRVIWLGSAETRRLRQFNEGYHERFWLKLLHFGGGGRQTTVNKRVRIDMNRTFTVGRPVQIQAEIRVPREDNLGDKPYVAQNPDDLPEITLKLPPGVGDKDT